MTKRVSRILQRRFLIAGETIRLQNLVHCGLSMIISAQISPTHPHTVPTQIQQWVGAVLNSGVLGMHLAPLVMEEGREG